MLQGRPDVGSSSGSGAALVSVVWSLVSFATHRRYRNPGAVTQIARATDSSSIAAMQADAVTASHAPLAALLVLVEIAVGTSVISHLIDLMGKIGRGFVGTTAVICAVLCAVAWLIAANLGPDAIAGGQVNRLDGVSHWLMWSTIALLGDAFFCAVGTDRARHVVGTAVTVIELILVASALTLAAGIAGLGAAALVIVPGMALSGAAWAGMLLGHWYLINPALSFRPLRQAVGIIFGAVLLEAASVVAGLLSGSASQTRQLISGGDAVLFWCLVVGSGIVFTAAVNGLTYYFARIRANQPATAMLYVLIISVLMGTVPAQLIFLQTGVGA